MYWLVFSHTDPNPRVSCHLNYYVVFLIIASLQHSRRPTSCCPIPCSGITSLDSWRASQTQSEAFVPHNPAIPASHLQTQRNMLHYLRSSLQHKMLDSRYHNSACHADSIVPLVRCYNGTTRDISNLPMWNILGGAMLGWLNGAMWDRLNGVMSHVGQIYRSHCKANSMVPCESDSDGSCETDTMRP